MDKIKFAKKWSEVQSVNENIMSSGKDANQAFIILGMSVKHRRMDLLGQGLNHFHR